MLQFAADENLNNDILRGVQRRNPAVDILRVQDAGLSAKDDASVLDWAARSGRVLLTHDVATMSHYAYERVRNGKSMPGVFEIGRHVPVRVATGHQLSFGFGKEAQKKLAALKQFGEATIEGKCLGMTTTVHGNTLFVSRIAKS